MSGTSVPKAPVYEHRYLRRPKYDIRASAQIGEWCSVHAVAQTPGVKRPPYRQFRPRVPRQLSLHAASNRGVARPRCGVSRGTRLASGKSGPTTRTPTGLAVHSYKLSGNAESCSVTVRLGHLKQYGGLPTETHKRFPHS